MGIAGLLPLLRSVTKRIHIEALAGQAVAIDAYSWLHKGVFLCATDLFHERPTRGYIEYCMARIRMLKQYNVRPIMVFDGAPLPMKAAKEATRLKSRVESRKRAHELLDAGDHRNAGIQMHKSIDVTPEMASALIQELKRDGIEFVVAPYEADAQMALLDRIGKVAAIVTEDSDMILFGCRRILYKLDRQGFADEVSLDRLGHNTDIELAAFDLHSFRQMCILSGCDYLESISGFGLKTCHKYFQRYKTAERVLQAIRAEFPSKVPADFEQRFRMAELTFLHQRVYDPETRAIVHLHPLTEDFALSQDNLPEYGNWEFVGPHVDDGVAHRIATGELNPISKLPFESPLPLSSQESFTAEPEVSVTSKAIRSRFFAAPMTTIEIEGDSQDAPPIRVFGSSRRLTLKSTDTAVDDEPGGKENVSPKHRSNAVGLSHAVSASSFSTLAKRPGGTGMAFSLTRDYLKSTIPNHNLYTQKRPRPPSPSAATKRPASSIVRPAANQSTLHTFLRKP